MSAITLEYDNYVAMSPKDRKDLSKTLSKIEPYRTLILDFDKRIEEALVAESAFADTTEFEIMGEKLTLGGVVNKALLGGAISYEEYTNKDKKNGEHIGAAVLVAAQAKDAYDILRRYQAAKETRGEKFSLQKTDLIHIIEAEMRAAL